MRGSLALPLLLMVLQGAEPAGATSPDRTLKAALPRLVVIRHRIHANPELGFREKETAAAIEEYLAGLGITEIERGVAQTGVVAVIRGGLPGPVVAVRADMDALPVTEETGFSFSSTKRDTYEGQDVGVAHACGHDIHVTSLLGVAAVLSGFGEELPGTVKLIFQPAEEGPPPGVTDGALQMIEQGVLENPAPEAIFGLHISPGMDVGEAGYTIGAAMAAVDRFTARIIGRSAHGAAPEAAVDPIVMGAQAVTALQTIRSRNLSPLEPSVITVGIFRGGSRYNIIPGEVLLEGTVRTYDPGVQDTIERRMNEILDGITTAGGGSYELSYRRVNPALVNEPALGARSVEALRGALGAENVRAVDPLMPGEDFAFFSSKIPGFYFHLGARAVGTASGGLHTPDMRADDGAIEAGVRAMTAVILDYLGHGKDR
jgi:amidohydrolase